MLSAAAVVVDHHTVILPAAAKVVPVVPGAVLHMHYIFIIMALTEIS